MARYDAFAGSSAQSWEYDHHGPVANQPDWAGHCHAWAGASVWESMPSANRTVGDVTFRPRDLAGLITEAYYNDTLSTEISLFRPAPGLLWRYLRQEIGGQNAMHGHAMGLVGNLTTIKGEVWNFPIYQYQINYSQDDSGLCSGTLTLWFADDGTPGYADSLGLGSVSISYTFSGVTLDGSGAPLDSGNWAGNVPSLYPTSIWRPYYAPTWTSYSANPQLDNNHLSQILGSKFLPAVTVPPPTLTMTKVGNQVALNWSTNSTGFVLESCSNLGGPQTWTTVTPDPVVIGGLYSVTNNADADSRFYRLRHP